MTRKPLLLLLALAALAAVAVLLAPDGERAPRELGRAAADENRSEERGDEPDASSELVPGSAGARRASSTGAAELLAPPPPSAPTAPRARAPLTGLVLSPELLPVAGALVRVLDAEGDTHELLDPAHNAATSTVAEVRTDAQGRFAVPVLVARPHRLSVRADGYATAQLAFRYAGEEVRVVLAHGARVLGRVLQSDGETPIADATVHLTPTLEHDALPNPGSGVTTTTDAFGAFEVEGLAPGSYDLEVLPRVLPPPRGRTVALAAGQLARVEVRVDAGRALRGQVIDAATRAPIAGAEVARSWRFGGGVRTDAAGRFELRVGRERRIYARAAGYGDRELWLPEDEVTHEPGDEHTIELLAGRQAVGRVVDAAGAPLADVYVAAAASHHGDLPHSQRIDWRAATTGADGAFALRDLRADLGHVLYLKRRGFGVALYQFPADEATRAVVDFGTLTLRGGHAVTGTVRSEAGAPLAGVAVELLGHNPDRFAFGEAPADGSGWSIDSYVMRREARTDDAGRFAFADVGPGTYTVSANLQGTHAAATHELHVEASAPEPVALELFVGLSIAGFVTVADGGTIPTCYLSIDPEHGGNSADVQVRSDGTFEARGLTEGTYRIAAYPYPDEPGRVLRSVTLSAVRAGERNVEVRLGAE